MIILEYIILRAIHFYVVPELIILGDVIQNMLRTEINGRAIL